MSQHVIDESNAAFWNTLCGWNLAGDAGITGRDPGDLRRFDELYLGFYPYLERYVPADFGGKKVLEVGLGYGTLGQLIASRGAEYHGVDIAAEPVAVMQERLSSLGLPASRARQASVLELPFADGAFDAVYSIGCLHHTGDLSGSVKEVHRVLAPRGRAVVMIYYRHSIRQLQFALSEALRRRRGGDEELRAAYDAGQGGEGAPHTDFTSRAEAKRVFADFARVRVDVRNFDAYGPHIKREWFLNNLARVVGLDLYIVADKA